MLGSSDSIACTNMMLNTAVAESLRQFADVLENATDFNETLHDLIQDTIKNIKGLFLMETAMMNLGYKKLKKRPSQFKNNPDCLPYYINEKNIKLLTEHKVLTETEIHARYEIILDNYSKTLNIEAVTMLDMAKKDLLPAFSAYTKQLSDTLLAKKRLRQVWIAVMKKSRLKSLRFMWKYVSKNKRIGRKFNGIGSSGI